MIDKFKEMYKSWNRTGKIKFYFIVFISIMQFITPIRGADFPIIMPFVLFIFGLFIGVFVLKVNGALFKNDKDVIDWNSNPLRIKDNVSKLFFAGIFFIAAGLSTTLSTFIYFLEYNGFGPNIISIGLSQLLLSLYFSKKNASLQ